MVVGNRFMRVALAGRYGIPVCIGDVMFVFFFGGEGEGEGGFCLFRQSFYCTYDGCLCASAVLVG